MFCTDSEAELLLPSPITSVVLSIIARMNSWVYTKVWEISKDHGIELPGRDFVENR